MELSFEWYEGAMLFCVFNFIFYLEPTVRNNTWMVTTSVTVKAIFSKVAFWKLPNHSYAQNSFSTITSITTFERHLTDEEFTEMG